MIDRERALERRLEKIKHASDDLGFWLSGALEDPKVCEEMKQSIQVWFDTIENSEHKVTPDD